MDLRPFIEGLYIKDTRMNVVPFRLNWAQTEVLDTVHDQINAGRPIRFITLKARQIGISTLIEAINFALAFAWDNMKGLVLAHEQDASQNLLEMTHRYWETFRFKQLYTPKYASRNELAWVETGSSIKVTTAGNKRTGRSATYNVVHASEVAFWKDPDDVMLGLRQTIHAVPNSLIALESTANGVGNMFYRIWKEAEGGDSEYVPLFFPWFEHPEYRASVIRLPPRSLGILDEEERILRNMGLDDDRLAWRRWAIKNLAGGDILKFHQEYPSSPDEAFIATGTNVFPIGRLTKVYEPLPAEKGMLYEHSGRIRFTRNPEGQLSIFKHPHENRDWGQYFVGADPTHTTRGDFAVAQVINRRTYEQVAVWRGRIDPANFATVLRMLGHYYNGATVATEREGPGYSTIGALLESQYPSVWRDRGAHKLPGHVTDSYGWSSTPKTKEWMVGWLLKLVVDADVTIHDRQTFIEMRDFVTLEGGGYGPADGTDHDDTVSALGIACICSASEGPLSPFADEPGYPEAEEQAPPWESWGETA